MIRRIPGCVLFATLAACSSGGPDPIVGAVIEQVGALWSRGDAEAAGAPRQAATRAQITAADVATIRARLVGDPAPTMLYATASNGGNVTYLSGFRQTITLRESQIVGTRGLGADLLAASSGGPDPLARPTPPAAWPSGVRRSYEFPAEGPQGRIETYDCRFELGKVTEITILEIRYRGVEVSETCTGPAGTFENLHFADQATGYVWRSLQWVGSGVDLVDLEIVLPYTGD